MGPILIYHDSQTAIIYTKDRKDYNITKQVDIKYNFTKDIIEKKEVNLQHIFMHHMIINPFTKPIPRDGFVTHVKSLRLCRI